MKKESSVRWTFKQFLQVFIPTANEDPALIDILIGMDLRHKQEMIDFGYSLLSTIQSESNEITYTKLPEELYHEFYEVDTQDKPKQKKQTK
jgi:hypothetical protein